MNTILSRQLGLLFFLCCFFPTLLVAEQTENAKRRPRIGLVLEGGGALGFAHVGVLKVLQEERIPVDLIAGTSMGSIVGAAYASGRTVPELEEVLATTDWDKLFNEGAPRRMVRYRQKSGRESEIYGDTKVGIKDGEVITPTALVEGQYIELLCQKLFGKSDPQGSFDKLPIPYRAVAADIETGETVILDRGSLAQAARASMSVPGFFSPVEINGRLLVDGGITNNFPVDVALDLGADNLIAVQFDTPLRTRKELNGPLAISAQILDLLLVRTSSNGLEKLRDKDVLIQPDIRKYTSTSFKDAQAIMKAGEDAARALVPKLRKFSISKEAYDKFEQNRTSTMEYEPHIDYVRVEGVAGFRSEELERSLKQQVGKQLNREQVAAEIQKTFESGEYQKIGYEVESKDGKNGIVVNARSKEWLKNYMRLGFALEDDFDGSSSYSLALDARLNELNSWGGYVDTQLEVGKFSKIFGEFYQPLGAGSRFFVSPDLTLSRSPLEVRTDGESRARYERESAVFGAKGGMSFGRFGEFTTGWRRGPGRLERDIGDSTLPEFDYDVGEAIANFIIDQYDNPDFPTEGYRLALLGTSSQESLGGSDDFEQGRVIGGIPLTHERITLLMNGEAGFSSNDLPVERSFAMGGAFDISGFEQASLTADNYWIGRALLFYRFLKGDSSLFNFGGYFGGTFEYASLRTEIEEIGDDPDIIAGSIFVGVDTPVLPIYFGFGMANESEKALFLNIGRLSSRRR